MTNTGPICLIHLHCRRTYLVFFFVLKAVKFSNLLALWNIYICWSHITSTSIFLDLIILYSSSCLFSTLYILSFPCYGYLCSTESHVGVSYNKEAFHNKWNGLFWSLHTLNIVQNIQCFDLNTEFRSITFWTNSLPVTFFLASYSCVLIVQYWRFFSGTGNETSVLTP